MYFHFIDLKSKSWLAIIHLAKLQNFWIYILQQPQFAFRDFRDFPPEFLAILSQLMKLMCLL